VIGKLVGLNPLLLIASLFVFGGLFGFVGLLFAVPLTAILMLFFRDWMDKALTGKKSEE
jgi:predicted PurR-regulated permease PerM